MASKETKVVKPVTAEKPAVAPKQETSELEILRKQVEDMRAMFAEMQKPKVVEKEHKSIGSTKIKVMSLIPYKLFLTTEPMGSGKVYSFKGYGDTQKIKFSDLEDIVYNHRKNVEDGIFYICDRKAIEELELTDEYEAIFDKAKVDEIVELKDQASVEAFLILSDFMKESVSRQIADKINEGVEYNFNYLAEIQRRGEIDIIKIAEDSKK